VNEVFYQSIFPKNGFVQVLPCQRELSPTIYYQVLDLRLRKHDEVLDQLSFQMHQLTQRVHKIEGIHRM